MTKKKTPVLKQAGTETMVQEFARLARELAVLDPAELKRVGDRLMRKRPVRREKSSVRIFRTK